MKLLGVLFRRLMVENMSQVPDQYIEETAELLGFVGALSVQIKHYNWKPEDYLNLPEYKKFFGDVDIFAKSPKKPS